MYKAVIIYMGAAYENTLNAIKYQELLGKIKILDVGVQSPFASYMDGYPLFSLEAALKKEWDYILIAGQEANFEQMKHLLMRIGINGEKVFSVNIFLIPEFDFEKYVELMNQKVSILSNHCWAGFTYHMLRAEFLSPFINMFIEGTDYIKLLGNFEEYMSLDVSYYGSAYEPNLKREYPIGLLGDVKLHFNHYQTFEDAKEKWKIRKQRINFNSLFVEMWTESEEIAEKFSELPFKQKIIFVPFETKFENAISLKCLDAMWEGEFYSRVNGIANGQLGYYDLLKLLNGEKNFGRYQ